MMKPILIGLLLLTVQYPLPAQTLHDSCQASSSAPRLDHVVIAVADIEEVAGQFARLGFRLKRGRLHSNNLLNRHIKFRDGTSLEFMTVQGPPLDKMATAYQELIAAGDGGAYAALQIENTRAVDSVAQQLALTATHSSSGSWRFVGFPSRSPASSVFFGSGWKPADDPDSLLRHGDGSVGLSEAWVEGGSQLIKMLELLGGRNCGMHMLPDRRTGIRIALRAGSVVVCEPLVTSSRHRLLGVVLATSDSLAGATLPLEVLPGFWVSYSEVNSFPGLPFLHRQ